MDEASGPGPESEVAVAEEVSAELEGADQEETTDARAIVDDQLAEFQSQVAQLQERYLRTAAEYENFRKRTAKERTDLWQRAQAEVVARVLDALDDFERVLQLDSANATAHDVIKGVELVERKLLRELEIAGLEKVGKPGDAFDPNNHEAIGALPAKQEEEDQTVGAVLQSGYVFGGSLIRPAKVQVLMWQGEDGSESS